MKKLKRNRAKCHLCDDIIESKSVHDFVECRCGSIFVDGGLEYQRAGAADFCLFEDLSEYEEI